MVLSLSAFVRFIALKAYRYIRKNFQVHIQQWIDFASFEIIDFASFEIDTKSLFGQQNLVTQFPSLITHHSSLNFTSVCLHHSVSITHYFSHYLEGPRLSRCSFFFSTSSFFFFFFPPGLAIRSGFFFFFFTKFGESRY